VQPWQSKLGAASERQILRPTPRTSVMSHHGRFRRTIVLDVVRVFAIMDGGRRSDPMLFRQRGAAETRQLPEISRRERRRCGCIAPSGLFHGSLYSCYQRSLKSNHLRSGDGYIFKTHRRSAGSPSVTSGSAANPPILFRQDGSFLSLLLCHACIKNASIKGAFRQRDGTKGYGVFKPKTSLTSSRIRPT